MEHRLRGSRRSSVEGGTMRFAGIDIASETPRAGAARRRRARSIGEADGVRARTPTATTSCSRLLGAPADVLIAMEATGHYWKNLFAVLTAAGLRGRAASTRCARRRFAARTWSAPRPTRSTPLGHRAASPRRSGPRPPGCPTRPPRAARARPPPRPAAPGLRRPGAPAAPPGRPRLPRVHPLRPQPRQRARHRASSREYPTAQAFLAPAPRRLAKLRYDGRHFVGLELADAADRGGASARSASTTARPTALQVRYLCQDLDLCAAACASSTATSRASCSSPRGRQAAHHHRRHRPADRRPPHRRRSATRPHFRSAGALAAYVGVVPGLRQSGNSSRRPRGGARSCRRTGSSDRAPRHRRRR